MLVVLIYVFLSFMSSGCEIKEPTSPDWNLDINLPFSQKSFNIFDILKRSGNIGFDSSENETVFLFGESVYSRKFGDDIRFDGYPLTNVKAVSTFQIDTAVAIDDSTFIRKAEFINGVLSFTFYNNTNENYTVNAVLKNLFAVSGNDTARIQISVGSGSQQTVNINLQDYFLLNAVPDNRLKLKIIFNSANPVPVNFSYSLSGYSVKYIEGKLKPLRTGITSDEVTDPFGSDVPQGELNFAHLTPDKNFLILKKFNDMYNVDFSNISITGENKNGNKVRLKYLRNGNPGDPVDSVFTLSLDSDKDSVAYAINESNSNILEFINNIPKVIRMSRYDVLNSGYKEGSVKNSDSISIKLLIQVPLDISITKPIVFSDTADAGISDAEQRKQMDFVSSMSFNIWAENHFPLKTVARILILDSAFVPLLAISRIAGNNEDSTVIVNAAPVGQDGTVINARTSLFSATLDSLQISSLKHMGKIIYDYKLYTEPDLIPPPLTTVKITGANFIKILSSGKIKYRTNF